MRATRAIVLYIVSVDTLTSLLAPLAFWAFQSCGYRLNSDWILRQPFERLFNRSFMLIALVGLWPLLRTIGFRSWNDVGFERTPDWRRHLVTGLALGVGSFLLAGIGSLLLGARALNLDSNTGKIVSRLLAFAGGATAVAVIEEIFFRGGIQSALQRDLRPATAAVAASAFYSIMHFFKPLQTVIDPSDIHWYSGFVYLGQMFARIPAVPHFGVQFITLLLVGLILGFAYVKTRALYLSIGLHAGWVFTLKSYALLTVANPGGLRDWLGGGGNRQAENLLTWPVLLVLFFIVARMSREDTDERSRHMDQPHR